MVRAVKVGILKTDAVRDEWVAEFGEYPDMFADLLGEVDPSLRFRVWDCEIGEFPESIDSADAWLITGSKSSVYEDKAWIRSLEALVRRLHAERRKLVGICFGHQLIAQALGGRVEKSANGWGVGIHRYQICNSKAALPIDDEFRLIVSHQDQVIEMPPGAEVLAFNDHCPLASLGIGEHILTFQGHPEFVPEYSRAIMGLRRQQIGEVRARAGFASLEGQPHQGALIARWIVAFMHG